MLPIKSTKKNDNTGDLLKSGTNERVMCRGVIPQITTEMQLNQMSDDFFRENFMYFFFTF